MLHCLTVAMLALGIASAPLYAGARAGDVPAGVPSHHSHLAQVARSTPGHGHVSPVKPHAMGQTCCHPGCIMAVVPGFATLTTDLLPWVMVPIPRDPRGSPTAPSGIDRPPKHA
ncbi:hypothetical protein [Microvirga calopogonii]|uniref:hypothetical protein n=1 Tax=Microvirga calopogonii TaxID=2078013 RepID=UPI0013B3A7F6|nr:hypothetical protein [Microvirga calopogonii]